MVKIFGREPAFLVGVVEATLAVLLSFGLLKFVGINGAEDVATVMAVVVGALGLYVAYVTKATLLGAGIAFLKSAIALWAIYGPDLNESQVVTIIALASLVLGSYQRTQTSPAEVPSFRTQG